MKKITKFISCLAALSGLLFGCANGLNGNTDNVNEINSRTTAETVNVTLHMLYATKGNWNVWAWKATSKTNYCSVKWPGNMKMTAETATGGYMYSLDVDPTEDLGLLFVASSGSPQTKDIVISNDKLVDGSNFYFIYDDTTVYNSAEECTGMKKAVITNATGSTVSVTIFGSKTAKAADFTVTGNDGTAFTVSKAAMTDKSGTLTLSNPDISKRPYTVTYGEKSVSANIDTSLIDELGIKYDGDDLGLTLNGTTATFKVWAPCSSSINLLLYTDVSKIGTFKEATVAAKAIGGTDEVELLGTPADTVAMTLDSTTGVWTASDINVSSYKYYKYQIVNNGETYYVCDINAKVAAGDSIAAQIADINSDSSAVYTGSYDTAWGTKQAYYNPFSGTKSYGDAVIYEMHIRDWSRAVVSDSTGKFLEIANSSDIINHLKDLGVTHVQILPMFDYAQVNSDEKYNWGYNPYHYNVPEGRYVTEGYEDGTQAVKEMRQMISALHDAGISVIMDVVYNHTNGTGAGSLYDSTVPEYFYRVSNGSYSNGSGCGNEVATNHVMVKKYVIDSLKHWMLDYHINGFRFDLMGVLESSTMADIYEALYDIDPNVLVYGEPWTGGTSAVVDGAVSAVATTKGVGFGAFDDDYRDAVKGAEFGGYQIGQVSGSYNDTMIANGLTGKSGKNNRNSSGISGLTIHYAECHDNYSLYDKLVYYMGTKDVLNTKGNYVYNASISGNSDIATYFADANTYVKETEGVLDAVKKQDKLAAAYVILAQGTPFINGGQEFLRTKKGDPDSYAADKKGGIVWTSTGDADDDESTNIDCVNTIDLSMKDTYKDVYNTYKGLIALRQKTTAFRNCQYADAKTLAEGVTLYSVAGGGEKYNVIFNATDNEYNVNQLMLTGSYASLISNDIDIQLGWTGKVVTISETDGSVSYAASETTVEKVPAKSFVILKK